ncbi:MAG: LCP family protein, partial [Bifidobacteriaceae bacterium]|nr:LCP family protein [Bifidobacteriaceae bacterium]
EAKNQGAGGGFPKWAARALSLALWLAVGAGMGAIARIGVLPLPWLIGAAFAVVVVAGAVGAALWHTKAPPSWFRFTALSLVALLGIGASAVGIKAIADVEGFVKGAAPKLPRSEYVVIALQDHGSGESSLQGENIGELTTDPNRQAVEEKLEGKFGVSFTERPDPTELAGGLTAKEYDAAVLDSSILAIYEEADPEFFESIQIIYTFDLDAPSMAAPPSAAPKESGESFVVYISGIDAAGAIATVSRSDVNILMVINPDAGRVLLVNTPRDYYVQLHGTTGTKDKLTHAGLYGVQKSIDTLQDLYGIKIDYYARVNFSSLVKIVDTLGGVDVNVEETFTSIHGNRTFPAGLNHLDGEQALAFSRERYAFAAGDRARGQNQQKVIAALIDKASQRSNLLRYNDLLDSLDGAFEMNVPMAQISSVVRQRLEDGKSWQVESASVDGQGSMRPTYSMGAQELYVMIPDQATVDSATQKINAVLDGQ